MAECLISILTRPYLRCSVGQPVQRLHRTLAAFGGNEGSFDTTFVYCLFVTKQVFSRGNLFYCVEGKPDIPGRIDRNQHRFFPFISCFYHYLILFQ